MKDVAVNEDQITTALAILGDRMEQAEKRLGDRMEQVEKRLGDRIDQLGDRIDQLGDRIDQVEKRLDDRIDQVEKRLDGRMGKMEIQIGKVASDVLSFRTDMSARIDRLQDTVTSVRDDIRVNYAATEAVDRRNNDTREDVRHLTQQVSIVYLRVKKLEDEVRELKGNP
jgi:chromosome segregation ATPase